MNRDTKSPNLPSLIGDLFMAQGLQVDNLIAVVWTKMHITTFPHRAGFQKRSGLDVNQVIYLLLVWVWLKSRVYWHVFTRIHTEFHRCRNQRARSG